MPSYTEITRPTAPTYEGIPKVGEFVEFEFQDGYLYEFQDENFKVFDDATDSLFTTITRPSVPTYTELTRPT